jgi:NodT family efflux transporter outer membrane factor (OMF) lipoprotein
MKFHRNWPFRPIYGALLASIGLAGCATQGGLLATVGPDYAAVASGAPARWQAPAPAADPRLGQLAQWWAQFNDPTLTDLIDAAQRESATIALAASRVERARADAVAAGVAGLPNLDLAASFARNATTFGVNNPAFGGARSFRNQATLGLQSSWEIDLFGGLARQRQSAEATFDANRAQWHDARVAVAAETANAYLNYRFCEMQVALAEADVRSRAETARLTQAAGQAGFQAPATVALAMASAADAASTLKQRRALCDIAIKGLVALTAYEEPALRQRLSQDPARVARLPVPARFAVTLVPADLLSQRPDVAAAERELASASADVGFNEAQRYPRLSLSGNITANRIRVGNAPVLDVTTWSIGPNLLLPLIDGGRRAANVEAAKAAYTAAESSYRAKVRQAVREVEEALVTLDSLQQRQADVQAAAKGYRDALAGAQARQRAGLGSVIELEDARRTSLAADAALAAIEQERVAAWISLYRALGGGWEGLPANANAANASTAR